MLTQKIGKQKNWRTENIGKQQIRICTIRKGTRLCRISRTRALLFVMCRSWSPLTADCEVTFTISCHTRNQTPHGVAIAIATWPARDRATPTPFMARGRSQTVDVCSKIFPVISIFDLHKSLFELIFWAMPNCPTGKYLPRSYRMFAHNICKDNGTHKKHAAQRHLPGSSESDATSSTTSPNAASATSNTRVQFIASFDFVFVVVFSSIWFVRSSAAI